MSGIEGYYHSDDWGGQYYPGKIFSNPDIEDPDEPGYYLEEKRDVSLDRQHWQNVSSCLQSKGLAPYQARLKIYELEKRIHDKMINWEPLKESPRNIVRLIMGEWNV